MKDFGGEQRKQLEIFAVEDIQVSSLEMKIHK